MKKKMWNTWTIVLVGSIMVFNIIYEVFGGSGLDISEMDGFSGTISISSSSGNMRFDIIKMVCIVIAIIGLMYIFRKIINPKLVKSKETYDRYIKILGKYIFTLYLPCIILMVFAAQSYYLLIVKIYINWLSPVLIAGITVSCLHELTTEKYIQSKILGAYLSLVLILVTIGNYIIPFITDKIVDIGMSKVAVMTLTDLDEVLRVINMFNMVEVGIAILWQVIVVIVSIIVLSRLVPIESTESSSLFDAN